MTELKDLKWEKFEGNYARRTIPRTKYCPRCQKDNLKETIQIMESKRKYRRNMMCECGWRKNPFWRDIDDMGKELRKKMPKEMKIKLKFEL